MVGVSGAGILDHREERSLSLLPIDDEGSPEDLVSAVLGVHLREAEELAVGQGTTETLGECLEVVDLLFTECEPLALAVGTYVSYLTDRLCHLVVSEYALVKSVIEVLEHRVVGGIGTRDLLEGLDTCDVGDPHIAHDLYGIGAPWGDQLPPSPDEDTRESRAVEGYRPPEEPGESL